MLSRHIVLLFTLAILFSVSAAGSVPTQDNVLFTARAKMKSKDFRAALATVKDVGPGGERDFIAGIASYRLDLWDDAVVALGRAASTYPLLADYSRYYQAKALEQLKRPSDMIAPLSALLTSTPDSPLARQALALLGDAHFQRESWHDAFTTYQRFITKYPAGAEALIANYRSALCKEKLGDPAAAVQLLYRLWLTSPGSSYADKADTDLKRLQVAGQLLPAPSSEDLYKRGVTLYDLKRYDSAIKTLQAIPQTGATDEFVAKVQFKTGQALFRAKHYKEAELTFSGLLPKAKGQAAEVWYWLARSFDRTDKDQEAIATYLKLKDQFAASDLADDALYQAAQLEEEMGKWNEAAQLLKILINNYPKSDLRVSAQWAYAWGIYRTSDAATAIPAFKKLLESDTYRDRALYWLAKAQIKTGDTASAQGTISQLLEEYPYGYYAQAWRNEKGLAAPSLPAVPLNLPQLLPWPAGFEREKALIAFGLTDEARTELARHRAKLPRGATAAGLARLHLEIDDYNGAYHLLKKRPRKLGKDPLLAWALSYPAAFRDSVYKQSSKNSLAPELVYGVMRTESSFSPTVVSPAGAIGLMQLMPATAALMGNGAGNSNGANKLKQPEQNIKLGARHLRDLLNLYKGDQVFAIAAYNAGAHNVDRWRKSIGPVPVDEFIERIPFAETRDYVKKVLSAAAVYRQLYPAQSAQPATPPGFVDYSSLNDD